jgi:hypothetical protein
MKTLLVSALAAAGLALSVSSAFALSNSPQGQVIVGGDAPAITSYFEGHGSHGNAATQPRFLSGQIEAQRAYEDAPNQTFGLSSNAIQGREFHAVQQGGHWLHDESGE